jgi:putative ABC transport system permease protein
MAHRVGQRAHEIGICIALGAQRRDVLRLAVGEGAQLAILGLAIGIAGALGFTRLMTSLLFEVRPTDPETFAGVTLLLAAAALAACYLPARRAARLDPAITLRHD